MHGLHSAHASAPSSGAALRRRHPLPFNASCFKDPTAWWGLSCCALRFVQLLRQALRLVLSQLLRQVLRLVLLCALRAPSCRPVQVGFPPLEGGT